MSKGLEALEEYKRVVCPNCQYKNKEKCDVVCFSNIIEKELKRLEELEKAFDSLSKDDEKAKKLLSKEIEKNRAFEIIKEKQVNVSALLALDFLEQYNGYCLMVGGCKYLKQEEYDLLKEVLVCENQLPYKILIPSHGSGKGGF